MDVWSYNALIAYCLASLTPYSSSDLKMRSTLFLLVLAMNFKWCGSLLEDSPLFLKKEMFEYGVPDNLPILQTTYVPTDIQCALHCREDLRCKAFKYEDGACYFYGGDDGRPHEQRVIFLATSPGAV
ncbi:hypothetical protein ScPMuIL_003441 [Solemya velum]